MKLITKIVLLLSLVTLSSISNATLNVIGIDRNTLKNKEVINLDKILFSMKKGDRLFFYDLGENEKNQYELVTSIEIPEGEGKPHKRSLLRNNRSKIKKIKDFIEKDMSSDNTNYLFIPQFMDEISRHVKKEDENIRFLISGNVLYHDKRESGFSMLNEMYPSDAHLSASSDQTPYSTKEKSGFLNKAIINIVHNDTWTSEVHRIRVERFWSLFIKSQGGSLVTFTPDFETAFMRLLSKKVAPLKEYNLDTSDREISMIKIRRGIIKNQVNTPDLSGVKWLDDSAPITVKAPKKSTGELQVGIKWRCKSCDFDLHTKSKDERKYLFYGNKESSDGYFNKDYLNSPTNANSLEYVVIQKSVNIKDLDIKINLYSGSPNGENAGEVRAYFNGKVYSTPFKINASNGNNGKNRKNSSTGKHWTTIDPKKLFNL